MTSTTGPVSGSVHVFEKVDGEWPTTEDYKLLASDGEQDDIFGSAIAVEGETVIVGAPWSDDVPFTSGSAYVFELIDGVWTETDKLTASDAVADAWFGASISISGDSLVVGAQGDSEIGTASGAAYVFERIDGTWTETAKLLASDGVDEDAFGSSVSVSGGTVLVGSRLDDDNGMNSGSLYVFEIGCACPADVNGDGQLNVLDFVAFQLLWQAGDPAADCDANGEFNVLDFVCFQQLFQAGCR